MSVKINEFSIENVKRVRAVQMEPTLSGLTIIGGENRQGKTSVIDALAWALGGDRFRPSEPTREGSVIPPSLRVTLSNGLVVERKGKNSELKVTDPSGRKGGQQLLNEFVEELALNLPKFMEANGKEKADILLRIIGVGDQLAKLERQEAEIYNNRLAIGRISDQKAKFAKEMPSYPDVPEVPVSASELIRQQQDILARNGENQHKRSLRDGLKSRLAMLTEKLRNLQAEVAQVSADYETSCRNTVDLIDEGTEELESNIRNIEALNVKIRANLDKERAEAEAHEYGDQYTALTTQLEDVRRAKQALLEGADLPLPGLSVAEGELVYDGQKWDNMSGSDRMKVATAIVRKLKPQCGFVLLDKLEQFDLNTLKEFGEWLEQEELQVIATRVSTGDECNVIITDGYAETPAKEVKAAPKWKAGVF